MKIECKLKRVGGTHVTIGATAYHFAALPDDAHVAEVLDEAHQDRFLSIPEAYRLYRGEVAAAPAAKEPAPVEILYGSSEHPANFEINGKTYALGDIVALAQKASGLDASEWNELADESRADLIDQELDKLNEAAPESPAQDDAAMRAELVAQFEAQFGKKPHHNAGIETIRAKLAEV